MFTNRSAAKILLLFAPVLLAACSTTSDKSALVPGSQSATQSNQTAPVARAGATSATPSGQVVAIPAPPASSIYFDFESTAIKDQFAGVTRAEADYLQRSAKQVEVQGNADERGSREYNMALGQKRAVAVKRALTTLGVNASRVETVSFGEDKPKAKGHDDAAWAENRRVDFLNK